MAVTRFFCLPILIFSILVNYTFAQWVIEDEGCRTPDRGVGVCQIIHQCAHVVNYLTNAPRPLTANDRRLLLSYQCGFEKNTVKVCCPQKPIQRPNNGGNGGTSGGSVDNISAHRNMALLTKNRCGVIQTDDKILNGNVTALFEFPWMALISYRDSDGVSFRCGGSLINERYILTAAHCITNLKRRTLAGVRLGEYDLSKDRDCEQFDEEEVCADPVQDLPIQEVIPHTKYDTKNFANDIGLIRLGRRVNMSVDSVKPICLPFEKVLQNEELAKGIVTGWGRTENSSQSNLLLKVEIPVMSQAECRNRYNNLAPITDKQICAGGVNSQDSCAGDSGGPLQRVQQFNTDVRYVQYGVVSFGPTPCSTRGLPGVYTKVAQYLDWILDNIRP